MSRPEATGHHPPIPVGSTLEVVWQRSGAAAFLRGPGGTAVAPAALPGPPVEVELAGAEIEARRLTAQDLVGLEAALPPGVALGDSVRAVFAVVAVARRAVDEGLVYPQLSGGRDGWAAFWGATVDTSVEAELAAIAAALPPVSAEPFDGDADAVVDDLYPHLVDRIARGRLVAAGVRLGSAAAPGRTSAVDHFLAGLAAPEPDLPAGPQYAALERQLTRWVDDGFARLPEASWRLGLRLDEDGTGRDGGVEAQLRLELTLQSADDPSLILPASLLVRGGGDAFGFLRNGDPEADLRRQLAGLAPLLAEHGLELDPDGPRETELDAEGVTHFLRELLPLLEERDVPVLLPASWIRSPVRIRANLAARAARGPLTVSSGLLSTPALAAFDWRLAVGDAELSLAELGELAAAKQPVVRIAGRWHAVRRADVERALRFLERRRDGGGVVELMRAVSGVETDAAGLELGAVELDAPLARLLGTGEARFRPLRTPRGMALDLFPFQERGHGWLRLLGDLGVGAILADDMGLGKTVQAIAMLVSEREDAGGKAFGPTLVVCPMSVARQWVAEIARFAPGLRVHLHHGPQRLAGTDLIRVAGGVDVVVSSYDVITRDVSDLAAVAWDRLVLDEAQEVKNPATKRARALRRLDAPRRVALTGTPIENRLSELWAIMDVVNPGLLGSRDWFTRTFVRPIEQWGDEHALDQLRAIVGPFLLRRTKTSPEVELDLPPITATKDYCRLTVEQATLYQATVDRWLPRIEDHDDYIGRRGAVLALLGQLKQICNHPEMLAATGRPLDGRSGKLERLVELLGDVPGADKALVFTQYPGFDRLVSHLHERLGRTVGFFHGGLSAARREELLASFADPDGPSLLVISIRAGGRGLNLPAANHVFHFDRWWNPAVEQQATDRVYRLGQHKPVFVHSLICLGTLEERIDRLLESKRELAEKVVAAHPEDWLGELDLDAIRAAVALAPDVLEQAA